MKNMFASLGRVVALGAILAMGATGVMAAEENKEKSSLSDRTVRVIMGMAYAAIPEQLPKPDGEMVKLDRSDPKKFMIPMDNAREIIIRSVLMGRAELCDLQDLKKEHFRKVMEREREKNWSNYQMIYIDHLSATTETFMTGQYAAGEDAKKSLDPKNDRAAKYTCSTDERAKVKTQLEQDIKKLAQAN